MTKEQPKKLHRRIRGSVVSDGMDKTITVSVTRIKMHPKYKKQYKVSKRYMVHDEKGAAKKGDSVIFEACRPLSKNKRWRLISVITKK